MSIRHYPLFCLHAFCVDCIKFICNLKSIKKIPKTFITFLLISLLIWLLITFSKEYSIVIKVPITYSELPQDKLMQKVLTKEIDILINGSGFNILSNTFKSNSVELNSNSLVKKTKYKYYLLLKNQKVNIQKQLLSGLQIEEILKDTIYLEIGSLVSKKVPVKPNLDIKYHAGYDLSEDIIMEPDSIFISGPEEHIQKINELIFSTLKLNDVKSDFENTVSIVKPKNSESIKFSTETIQIKGNVEKFTEGNFHIPFKVVNLPANIQLATLSKTVEIVYVVGLSDFNKIEANSFKVECDFAISKENNLGYLIPKITSKSGLVKNVKVLPNKIDFLIQK